MNSEEDGFFLSKTRRLTVSGTGHGAKLGGLRLAKATIKLARQSRGRVQFSDLINASVLLLL